MYFQFLIEDQSTNILVEHVMIVSKIRNNFKYTHRKRDRESEV